MLEDVCADAVAYACAAAGDNVGFAAEGQVSLLGSKVLVLPNMVCEVLGQCFALRLIMV